MSSEPAPEPRRETRVDGIFERTVAMLRSAVAGSSDPTMRQVCAVLIILITQLEIQDQERDRRITALEEKDASE